MFYINNTPKLLRSLYKGRVWDIPNEGQDLFLTFDDGPHPEVTTFVLDLLAKFNAKATFFCIGKNVEKYPAIYERILLEGHAVGNHSMNHLNASKVKDKIYLEDIAEAQKFISSNLFRPPYGRLSNFQQKQLQSARFNFKIIMWSVLSADFDLSISPERCLQNVLLHTKTGSIIVFHDSEKARKNLEYALPKTLEYFADKGFAFKKLEENELGLL